MRPAVADRRRRCPASTRGRPPRNKGLRYPADPPQRRGDRRGHAPSRRRRRTACARGTDRRALARRAAHQRGARAHRERPRRAPRRGAGPPRQGRQAPRGRHGRLGLGATRARGWTVRVELPVGPLFCVINGPTAGRPWSAPRRAHCGSSPRTPASADASRRTNSATPTPSRWRARASRSIVIQRQLGHANLGVTSIYLQGIDNGEIIDTVHATARADAAGKRRPALAGLPSNSAAPRPSHAVEGDARLRPGRADAGRSLVARSTSPGRCPGFVNQARVPVQTPSGASPPAARPRWKPATPCRGTCLRQQRLDLHVER